MSDTKIEWADRVWNPTTGCDRVSPGCDNCYALTMAKRLKGMGSEKYQTDGDPRTSGPGFGIAEHASALDAPLRWRKPSRVFVNSMSDLFHAGVSDEFLHQVFAVMAATPQHTYQILTKRHGRTRSVLNDPKMRFVVEANGGTWPLPNAWGGVSVEDQQRAELRIPALVETPYAVRFLSCEPLLGPVDVTPWLDRIDWVIAGGESGPGARPMHPDWARRLRDQCTSAGVPFFFKQWGAWAPTGAIGMGGGDRRMYVGPQVDEPGFREEIELVGKKAAGRELDGRTWDEYPEVVA